MKCVMIFLAAAMVVWCRPAASMPADVADAPVLWRNDWFTSAPLTLNHYDLAASSQPSVAFAPDRDVVLAAPSQHMIRSNRDYHQIVRLRADGTVRWVNSLGGFGRDGQARAIRAEADGSATVLLGSPSDDSTMIARLGADGEMLWRRYQLGSWVARVSPARLVVASCSQLTMLDEVDGNVVWQRSLGTIMCARSGLQIDGEGHLYVISGSRRNGMLHYKIAKFDAAGDELWHQDLPAGVPDGLVGTGPSLIYLSGRDELVALRASDGSVAWSAPSSGRVVMGGAPNPEPIVIRAQSIERLNAETGQPRWKTSLANVRTANVVADSLLLAGAGARQRVDLASGAIVWNVPNGDNSVIWLAFGDLDANTVRALGRPGSFDFVAAPYLDYRINFANGQLVSQLPAVEVEQGLDAISAVDIDGNVVEFALSQQPGHARMHLRRVDATSGATLWEQADLLDDFGPEIPIELQAGRMTTTGAQVAVAVPLSDWPSSPACGAGGAHVASYNLADGTLRWNLLLSDSDQLCTEISTPVLDSDGNVFLSVSARMYCDVWPPRDCQRRTLYKLRNHDGAVLWRINEDMEGLEWGSPSDPKELYMFGDDPIVSGPFAGETATLRRYSGVDGSILWSSVEFAGPNEQPRGLKRIDDHHLILYGTDLALNQGSSAKIDTDTGAMLWRAVNVPSPVPACESYSACLGASASIVMPGGDTLSAFQLNWDTWLALRHNDGSGIIERWMTAPGSAILASSIGQIVLDPNGLRATLRRQIRGGLMSLLSTIDSSNGLLTGQQALYGYAKDSFERADLFSLLALRSTDRLLVGNWIYGAPHPSSTGIALLDTSVTAHGNLKTVATIGSRVAPGDLVSFMVKADYNGDHPIDGVKLFARLPWQSGIRNAACTMQAASNCSLDLRSGHVRASFDASPGGSVEIHGEVLVQAADDLQRFTAMVTGPLGLREEDSIDNFARVDVLQSLFRSGFEATQ